MHFLALLFALQLCRLKGIKIIWTMHNFCSHEERFPVLEAILRRSLLKVANGIISLTKSSHHQALEQYPRLRNIPFSITPHGHYREVYPNRVTSFEAKKKLGFPAKSDVICFFGAIRRYKNIPFLIDNFRQLKDENLYLVIGGKTDSSDLVAELIQKAGEDSRIRLHLEFIPEEKMQVYLNASSVVVLPYEEILNSGSAILALSFNRPVIVPDKGSMSELQTLVGSEWVFTYKGALTQLILSEAVNWYRNVTRAKRASLEALSWDSIAKRTIGFYDKVLNEKKKD